MIVYHASDIKFDSLCYDMLLENSKKDQNGNIGLWCSYTPAHWIRGFGKYIYKIELPDLNPYELSIWEICGITDFKRYRERRINEGYNWLKVIEPDNTSHMLIILNFSNVKILSRDKL